MTTENWIDSELVEQWGDMLGDEGRRTIQYLVQCAKMGAGEWIRCRDGRVELDMENLPPFNRLPVRSLAFQPQVTKELNCP